VKLGQKGTLADVRAPSPARNNLPREMIDAVAASRDVPASMAGPLARLTVFARHAAPILIETATHGEASALDEPLALLARPTGLDSVAPAEMSALCLTPRVPR
jgi:hypothetical protein